MRLVTPGFGAADPPRYRPAGLLVARRGVRVMLDGGPGGAPSGRLDAWLVTDERAELRSQLRRLAAERGLHPHAGSFQRDALRIDARPVVHTSHPTFGDLIEAPEGSVVWAPEFLESPGWAHGARLLFAEAAGWERPIRFAGGVGGHLHVPVVSRPPAVTGSAAWCSPTSGGPPSGPWTAGAARLRRVRPRRPSTSGHGPEIAAGVAGNTARYGEQARSAGGLSGQAGPGTDAGAVR